MNKFLSVIACLFGCLSMAHAITATQVKTSWYTTQDLTIHTSLGDVTLRAGTPIVVEVYQNVDSKNLNAGQTVSIRAKFNVVVDKQTVIAAGSIGNATVTDIKKAGIFGKPGKIELQVQSVQAVDGQQVQLSGIPLTVQGDDKTFLAWGLSIGLGLLTIIGFGIGFFIKGKSAEIKAGTTINTTVASDVDVNTKKH